MSGVDGPLIIATILVVVVYIVVITPVLVVVVVRVSACRQCVHNPSASQHYGD